MQIRHLVVNELHILPPSDCLVRQGKHSVSFRKSNHRAYDKWQYKVIESS